MSGDELFEAVWEKPVAAAIERVDQCGWARRALLQGLDDHRLDVFACDLVRFARARLIVQAVDALLDKAAPPAARVLRGVAQARRDVLAGSLSAAASTIRQRSARAWALLGRRAQRSSASPLGVTSTRRGIRPPIVDCDGDVFAGEDSMAAN